MADEELHYPPGAEPNPPAPEEAPKDEPAPEAPAPEEPAPEGDEPEEKDKKDDEPAPEVPIKKRSIYDDLKDTRRDVKDYRAVAVAALKAQGIEVSGKETAAELQGLMEKNKTPDAPTPPAPKSAPSKPADELEAYAKENGLDAAALGRLVDIVAKRIPPSQLSAEEKQQLRELTDYKAKKDAEEVRAAEDNAIKAEAPKVKEQLQIHDETELSAVMDEIVKLAHSERYHDKEVDYIVFREKEKLAKLVSPKKPSFENGGQPGEAAPEAESDFSSGKGITPDMAMKASQGKSGSGLQIRKAK